MLSGLHDTKHNELYDEDFEPNNLISRINDVFKTS
jgi:hypothetical protein